MESSSSTNPPARPPGQANPPIQPIQQRAQQQPNRVEKPYSQIVGTSKTSKIEQTTAEILKESLRKGLVTSGTAMKRAAEAYKWTKPENLLKDLGTAVVNEFGTQINDYRQQFIDHPLQIYKTDFKNKLLRGSDWRGIKLEQPLNFDKSNFSRAQLAGAGFPGSSFYATQFQGMITHDPKQPEAKVDFSGAQCQYANFTGQLMDDLNLDRADLSHADLTQTDWRGFNPEGKQKLTLDKANFLGANLLGTRLPGSSLQEARLQNIITHDEAQPGAKTDLIETNLSGARLIKLRLKDLKLRDTNLTAAALYGSDLRDQTFRRVDLSKTIFDSTKIARAQFPESKFVGADFSNAIPFDDETNKKRVDLSNCDLTSAKFNKQRLRFYKFDGAILDNTNLIGADMAGVDFSKVKSMSGAQIAGDSMLDPILCKLLYNKEDLTCNELRTLVTSAYNQFRKVRISGSNNEKADLKFLRRSREKLDLAKAKFDHVVLEQADIDKIKSLRGAEIKNSSLRGLDLSKVDCRGMRFIGCDLTEAVLPAGLNPKAFRNCKGEPNISQEGSAEE